MWVVRIVDMNGHNVGIELSELRMLGNGVLVSTGNKTPLFDFDPSHGSYNDVAIRLRRAVEFVPEAGAIDHVTPEILVITSELAERLEDIIVDQKQDQGGDDFGEMG